MGLLAYAAVSNSYPDYFLKPEGTSMLKAYTRFIAKLNALRNDEEGATAVEYGLLVALIAAVIIAVVLILGPLLAGAFDTINDGLTGAGIAPPD
ncbi:Flp family type IVb pilin [Agromyces bauzanensis]|uniref:Flp family type IVb pilin n=1 Tax=Agromyces bauzanensis TaxID=1308924 RepID=UPI001E2BCC58|nr:Flp family type IVb pilin [Agromyces bauzanensis]